MSVRSSGPGRWSLVLPDPRLSVPASFHPAATLLANLADDERRVGVADECILLDPSGSIDRRLQQFFRSIEFEALAKSSRETYALDLKTWLDFIHIQGVTWDKACEDDFAWFKRWRLDPSGREGNEGRIQPATWNRSVAALDMFYRWAVNPKRGYLTYSPLPDRGATTSGARSWRSPALAGNAKRDRARWVVPTTARLYRDVGLRGYTIEQDSATGRLRPAGVSPGFRGRNVARNSAFFDLTYSTALRRSEAGSLLVVEVPSTDSEVRLAAGTAKGGHSRHYVAQGPALVAVQAYMRHGRQQAIRRARRAGRYDEVDVVYVARVEQRRRLGKTLVMEDGTVAALDQITPADRVRLFTDTGSGWEPMSLWLAEDGLPMDRKSWHDVFDTANRRLAREVVSAGRDAADSPILSPHSLRSSFALWVLAALHRQIDERLGIDPDSPYDERRYVSAYEIVQDLLGHSSVETTRNVYLEPVKGVRRAVWLENAADVHDVLSNLAAADDRVIDIAARD